MRLVHPMTRRSLLKFFLVLTVPLAASAKKPARIFRVIATRCVGCKDCWGVCPVGAIDMVRGKALIDPETCTGCRRCKAVCSYGAVGQCEIEKPNNEEAAE
jgi:Fe-S-cluster-containing hydrogenase component 2